MASMAGTAGHDAEKEKDWQYEEELPSTRIWLKTHLVDDFQHRFWVYLQSLLPIFGWIGKYNVTWLIGDLIAGITVGCIVVPQSMSYAQLADLPTEYGLYSSFVGVFIYCFFATSKDVTIGPVAVMSLLVADTIKNVLERTTEYSKPDIATCFALLVGAIVCAIGLLRLGFIIEFIPTPAVAGFMTGSAITIASGQVVSLMGLSKKVNSRQSAYKVIIKVLKHLPDTKVDAAFGLISLFILYLWRFTGNTVAKRRPKYERYAFFALVLRSAVVIIVGTAISYGVCKDHRDDPPISIVKTVPRGFKHVGLPTVSSGLARELAPELPVGCIVLLLEHIAIGKSFGRVNNYRINPNQELIAIGVTNMIGTFFNAYPATGSFSRTAIKARSGVRTPIAGIYTGVVVIIALYALTEAFYWIPKAVLAAVIIHAVGDLIVHPRQLINFWKIQPVEAIIFLAGVIITVFTSVEDGIYTTIATSGALLLYRIAKPRGRFLGLVRVAQQVSSQGDQSSPTHVIQRDVFVPLDQHMGGPHNPSISVNPPPPGIIIYRLEESFLYPNASETSSQIALRAKEITRPGKLNIWKSLGDRPWNYPGPRKLKKSDNVNDTRPLLHAVILDFSSVSHIDTTGIQGLVDTRKELELHADGPVEFRFANILSPWVKRALVAGGFGIASDPKDRPLEVAGVVPLPSGLLSIGDEPSHVEKFKSKEDEEASVPLVHDSADKSQGRQGVDAIEEISSSRASSTESVETQDFVPILGSNTPYFHVDIADALRHALSTQRKKQH